MNSYPLFFPRGSGPLVSILLPTRGRSESLVEALDSLVNTADDKSRFEIVLRIDDDDPETLETIDKYVRKNTGVELKVIAGLRGNGYSDFHLYLTELATVSMGDWLMMFNDDAKMQTKGWDTLLLNTYVTKPFVGIQDIFLLNCNNDYSFYFLRRKVFEVLGRIAPHCSTDYYLFNLLGFVIAKGSIGVDIKHSERYDKSENRIWKGECILSGLTDYRTELLHDAGKLVDYLQTKEKLANWLEVPNGPGWYIWKSGDGRKETAFVKPDGSLVMGTMQGYEIPIEKMTDTNVRWYLLNNCL